MLSLSTEDAAEDKTNTSSVRTNFIPLTTEYHQLFKKMQIHASRHIVISTGGEVGTGNSRKGGSNWVTDVCCYSSEL